MVKLYKLLFLNTLLIGTLISISAYSWFSMWIGLEMNLLSIIPLMKSSKNIFPTESALKYFLTQSLASTFILFTFINILNSKDFLFSSQFEYLHLLILNSALLTKLGAAPFHTWFPEVMEGLNWMNGFLLMTWQKLAPFVLISYNLEMLNFMSMIIILSAIISGILGINQISMRKIMAYSSINHIAWMLSSLLNYKTVWTIYFLVYSMITLNIVLIFWKMNIFNINQLFSSINSDKSTKLLFIMNFMSLGGLPPFLGFLPKWLVINNLIISNNYTLSLILIIFTLITLYFYIRITMSTLTISMNETLVYHLSMTNYSLIIFNVMTLTALPLMITIFNMI